jgi:hypothetical protein
MVAAGHSACSGLHITITHDDLPRPPRQAGRPVVLRPERAAACSEPERSAAGGGEALESVDADASAAESQADTGPQWAVGSSEEAWIAGDDELRRLQFWVSLFRLRLGWRCCSG